MKYLHLFDIYQPTKATEKQMPTTIPSHRKDSLEILQELVQVASPQKLQKVKPIIAYDKEQKLRKLYDGMRLKKWRSESEAIRSIYGKQGSPNAFAKLKSDLSEKLVSDILLINVNAADVPEAKKALRDCLVKYHTALLMYRFTPFHKAPDNILEKIFPKCLKYEFTELIIGISDIMAWKYKLHSDLKKGAYYEQILLNHLKIQEFECRGKIFLGNIYAQYACSRSFKPEIVQQATHYLQILDSANLPCETQKTIYFKRMLEVICLMSKFNYLKTAQLCEDTIDYFESKSFTTPSILRAFYFQAIASYTYLREPEKGYLLLKKCNLLTTGGGSFNWFKLQELTIIMALYAEDYQRAAHIFLETTSHERFAKMPSHLLEYWKLLEAMLSVVESSGLIRSHPGRPFQIRFSSLANSVPQLIRDKRGLNFAVHLLRFFTLVQKGNAKSYQNYDDCLEQLGNYVNRYCRDESMQRTRWIYQLLCQISRHGFVKKAVLHDPETKIFMQHLQKTPYDITDANLDIEIIPFDHFFNIICSKLQ